MTAAVSTEGLVRLLHRYWERQLGACPENGGAHIAEGGGNGNGADAAPGKSPQALTSPGTVSYNTG